ncbi:hypothetical protein [Francisella tularensis]|nr:hypothetical protein [Francisella tularensis]MBD5784459.1 hypothetical protein [Francisella tularensis subsp. holarctica]
MCLSIVFTAFVFDSLFIIYLALVTLVLVLLLITLDSQIDRAVLGADIFV